MCGRLGVYISVDEGEHSIHGPNDLFVAISREIVEERKWGRHIHRSGSHRRTGRNQRRGLAKSAPIDSWEWHREEPCGWTLSGHRRDRGPAIHQVNLILRCASPPSRESVVESSDNNSGSVVKACCQKEGSSTLSIDLHDWPTARGQWLSSFSMVVSVQDKVIFHRGN